jgi:hypothetical protein
MSKQILVIILLGLSSLAIWGTEAEAYRFVGISYGPGGSFICTVKFEYENVGEKIEIIDGNVDVTCDQFIEGDDIVGLCSNPKGIVGKGRGFISKQEFDSFENLIKANVNFETDCTESESPGFGICTVDMIQPSNRDDIQDLIDAEAPLPSECGEGDSAQECIEALFGGDSEQCKQGRDHYVSYKSNKGRRHDDRGHKKKWLFYGIEFEFASISSILTENDVPKASISAVCTGNGKCMIIDNDNDDDDHDHHHDDDCRRRHHHKKGKP